MNSIITPAGRVEVGMIVTGIRYGGSRRTRVEVDVADEELQIVGGLIMGKDGGAYEGSFLGRCVLDPRTIQFLAV